MVGESDTPKPHCVPMFIYINIAIAHVNVILENSVKYGHIHKFKLKNILFFIQTILCKNDMHTDTHEYQV